MPIMPRPTASRAPARRNGTALGRMMLRNRNGSPAEKLRATRTRRASTVRTAASALMAIGSTASSTMISTRQAGPDPDEEQRQKRHLRRRVQRGEKRFHRIGEAAIPAGGETERNADDQS